MLEVSKLWPEVVQPDRHVRLDLEVLWGIDLGLL